MEIVEFKFSPKMVNSFPNLEKKVGPMVNLHFHVELQFTKTEFTLLMVVIPEFKYSLKQENLFLKLEVLVPVIAFGSQLELQLMVKEKSLFLIILFVMFKYSPKMEI